MTLDKTLATQEAYSAVLLFGMQNKIAVYGISDKLVKAGALLDLAADYSENGKRPAAWLFRLRGAGSFRRTRIWKGSTCTSISRQPATPGSRSLPTSLKRH